VLLARSVEAQSTRSTTVEIKEQRTAMMLGQAETEDFEEGDGRS